MIQQGILLDMLQALRSCAQFEDVTIGRPVASTALPRAALIFDSQETFAADDSATHNWARLQTRIVITARHESMTDLTGRGLQLVEAAASAILGDPYRGGLCQDLPIGKATQINRQECLKDAGPHMEFALTVLCHFEVPEE